jgi:hypothetical protein
MSHKPNDPQHDDAMPNTPEPHAANNDTALNRIGDALRGLRYGSVLAQIPPELTASTRHRPE